MCIIEVVATSGTAVGERESAHRNGDANLMMCVDREKGYANEKAEQEGIHEREGVEWKKDPV